MLAMEWLNRFTAREEVAETCKKVAEIGREAISKPMERSPAVRGDVVIGTAPIAVMTIGDTTTVMIDPGVSELIIKPGQNIVIRSRVSSASEIERVQPPVGD